MIMEVVMKRVSAWATATVLTALIMNAADGTWSAGSGGTWSNTTKWLNGNVAAGAGSTATFESGSGTIDNDMPGLQLLGLKLIAGSYQLVGNSITLDSSGSLKTESGTHIVALPLVLSGPTSVEVASGETLNLNGAISGSGDVTLYGGRTILGSANTYQGTTLIVTGIVETATVDAFGSSSANAENLVIGEGILRYTGASDTLDRGFTIAPTNNGARAAILEVTDPDTTLTVAGQIQTVNGAFIKTGPGTLKLTYEGNQVLGKNTDKVNDAADLVIDANGSASTNGYSKFTLDEGRLILGVPGQYNEMTGHSWVGSRTVTSPRLDIIGGTTRVKDSYFTISRGTGTDASPQTASVYLSNGALFDLHSLVMGFSNGRSDYRGSAYLEVDNATCTVSNNCFISESSRVTSEIKVKNGGLFQSNSTAQDQGLSLSQVAGASTTMNIEGGSTLQAYQIRVGRGAELNVTDNSVFELDTTPVKVVLENLNQGVARFDNATLKQRTEAISSDWFSGLTDLFIASGGITANVTSYAWLAPQPVADPSSSGGSITKTGNGTLAMQATPLNTTVNQGSVRLSTPTQHYAPLNNGTISLASGTSLELAANGAASSQTLNLDDNTLLLRPNSLTSHSDSWNYFTSKEQNTVPRKDGLLQLVPESGIPLNWQHYRGSAYLKEKRKINQPWQLCFNYICWTAGNHAADGFTIVIHNDPRPEAWAGSSGGHLGFHTDGTNKLINSVAVGVDVHNGRFRLAKQGQFVASGPNKDSIRDMTIESADKYCHMA